MITTHLKNCVIIGKAHFAVVGNISHKIRDFYCVYVEPNDIAASDNSGEEYRCTKDFYEDAILGGEGYSILTFDSNNFIYSGNPLSSDIILSQDSILIF